MTTTQLSRADQVRHTRYLALQKEVAALEEELKGHDCEKIVKDHLKALQEYNDRKDAGCIIMGKIADLENTTVGDIYGRFGLSHED